MNTRTQFTNNGAFLGATQQRDFQLPPCAPGKEWHGELWEADMLDGYRPLCVGEQIFAEDEYFAYDQGPWKNVESASRYRIGTHAGANDVKFRTRRPLTFEHAGKTWTWHRPGDPMPCVKTRRIDAMMMCGTVMEDCDPTLVRWSQLAMRDGSQACGDIIGWRYADEKTTVEFGPSDVPPGSVLLYGAHWISIIGVHKHGVEISGRQGSNCIKWAELRLQWPINRSIPLTGKWDANAWEPCHKEEVSA